MSFQQLDDLMPTYSFERDFHKGFFSWKELEEKWTSFYIF